MIKIEKKVKLSLWKIKTDNCRRLHLQVDTREYIYKSQGTLEERPHLKNGDGGGWPKASA